MTNTEEDGVSNPWRDMQEGDGWRVQPTSFGHAVPVRGEDMTTTKGATMKKAKKTGTGSAFVEVQA